MDKVLFVIVNKFLCLLTCIVVGFLLLMSGISMRVFWIFEFVNICIFYYISAKYYALSGKVDENGITSSDIIMAGCGFLFSDFFILSLIFLFMVFAV